MRVIIVVTRQRHAEVLIDGVMTNHEVAPGSDAGTSLLTVTGEDLTRVMDYHRLQRHPLPGACRRKRGWR